MLNEQLRQISAAACVDLATLIASGEEDILKAIRIMQVEAELQDSTPKFVLGFKIALDTDSGAFDCALNWSVRQTLSVSHSLEDPKQEKLGLDDEPKRSQETTANIRTRTHARGLRGMAAPNSQKVNRA